MLPKKDEEGAFIDIGYRAAAYHMVKTEMIQADAFHFASAFFMPIAVGRPPLPYI